MANILVLYHDDGGCLDGAMAATSLWSYFHAPNAEGETNLGIGQEIKFVPVSYGDPIPDLADQHVFIVDFSFDPTELAKAALKAVNVTLLDHHKNAIDKWLAYATDHPDKVTMEWKVTDEKNDGNVVTKILIHSTNEKSETGNVHAYFATKMSGAVLTWRYLNLEAKYLPFNDEKTPLLLRYAQDWDLHTKQLEGVAEITTALYARPHILAQEFDKLDRLITAVQYDEDALAEVRHLNPESTHYFNDNDVLLDLFRAGQIVYGSYQTLIVGMIKRSVKFVDLCGHKVPLMYCPRELRTLAGGMLAKGHPFAVVYEDCHVLKERQYSFRSDKDDPNSVNVDEIAKQFGGGGHEHAAGLKTSINDTPIWNLPHPAAYYASSPHD